MPRQDFDRIGSGEGVTLYRFGLLYPADGPQPERWQIEGTIPHRAGPDAKVRKFYLPAQRIDLVEERTAVYSIPRGLRGAGTCPPYGELVLNDRPDCTVRFGREDEEHPFGFTPERRYVFLRVYRKEEVAFKPLYMEVSKDQSTFWYRMDVEWVGDTITARLTEISLAQWDEIPDCLKNY